jgi:hypothetical protein
MPTAATASRIRLQHSELVAPVAHEVLRVEADAIHPGRTGC